MDSVAIVMISFLQLNVKIHTAANSEIEDCKENLVKYKTSI